MPDSRPSGGATARSRPPPVSDSPDALNGAPRGESDSSVVELPKRKPGRPRGAAKWPGSGRKKGQPNKSTADLRKYIHRTANPVRKVAQVANGKLVIDGLSQADAIKMLYRAVIPEFERFTVKWNRLLVPTCLVENLTLSEGLHQRLGLGVKPSRP